MIWGFQGADYVVWHRLLEDAGDLAMATRLDAVHAAEQCGCKKTISLPGGEQTHLPLIFVAEAAAAAQQGKSESQWREEFIRALLDVAVADQSESTTRRVTVALNAMGSVIEDLKWARVWPWMPQRRRKKPAEPPP